MTPQPTPRGTDMANLSEPKWETMHTQTVRLGRVGMWAPGSYVCKCSACERQFEGDKRAMNCLPCAVSRLSEIADRLTVEGLAGVIGVQLGTMGMTTGLSANLHHDLAVSLIDYITTPSVEESHDR